MSKLYFRYAAMNAGKSTNLLQVAYNYEERGQEAVIYTAGLDERAGRGIVASRLGVTRPARTFSPETSFADTIASRPGCVLVDEAQFLTPDQVRQLHRLSHEHRVPVICYGLRPDSRGPAFPGALELLALADTLEGLTSIFECG